MTSGREAFEEWAKNMKWTELSLNPSVDSSGVYLYDTDKTCLAYIAFLGGRASLPSAQPSDVVEAIPPQEELTLVALWWRAEDDSYKVAKPRFNAFSTDADALYVDVTEDSNHTTRYLARQQTALSIKDIGCGDIEEKFNAWCVKWGFQPNADLERGFHAGYQAALTTQQAQSGEWLLIETAPKDGTKIRLRGGELEWEHDVPKGGIYNYKEPYTDVIARFEEGYYWYACENVGVGAEVLSPTHWMPLTPFTQNKGD